MFFIGRRQERKLTDDFSKIESRFSSDEKFPSKNDSPILGIYAHLPHDTGHGHGGDALLTADEAHALVCCGFDAYLISGDA